MNSHEMNNEMICLEESLKLWWICIQHAPFLTNDVTLLFGYLDHVLEQNIEYETVYKRAMRIIQAYVLTGKAAFLKTNLPAVVSCLTKSLSHYFNNTILVEAIDVIQTMIRIFPNDSPRYLTPCLTVLMRLLLSDDCPNSSYFKQNAYSEGVAVFLDILILNPQFFFEFIGCYDLF